MNEQEKQRLIKFWAETVDKRYSESQKAKLYNNMVILRERVKQMSDKSGKITADCIVAVCDEFLGQRVN